MAVRNKESILRIFQQNEKAIRAFGVRKIGLFGSFVRNEQDLESDVDVLVEFEPEKKTFDNFIALSFLLEEKLDREVGLVTSESLSPYIGPYILQEVEYVDFAS
jgi:predicted nucleotidyltransferase